MRELKEEKKEVAKLAVKHINDDLRIVEKMCRDFLGEVTKKVPGRLRSSLAFKVIGKVLPTAMEDCVELAELTACEKEQMEVIVDAMDFSIVIKKGD